MSVFQAPYPSALALQAFLRARGIENECIIVKEEYRNEGRAWPRTVALIHVHGELSKSNVSERVAQHIIQHFRIAWATDITKVEFLECTDNRVSGTMFPVILSYTTGHFHDW